MLLKLLLAFTVIPIVELMLLIKIAGMTGLGWALLLVIVTGILGSYLARRQGLQVLGMIQRDLARGIPPTEPIIDGAFILVSGVLLITPGLLTDITGFLLLASPVRALLRRKTMEWFRRKMKDGSFQSMHFHRF